MNADAVPPRAADAVRRWAPRALAAAVRRRRRRAAGRRLGAGSTARASTSSPCWPGSSTRGSPPTGTCTTRATTAASAGRPCRSGDGDGCRGGARSRLGHRHRGHGRRPARSRSPAATATRSGSPCLPSGAELRVRGRRPRTATSRRSPSPPDAPLQDWRASVDGGRVGAGVARGPAATSRRTSTRSGTVDVVARGIRDSLFDVGAPVLGRPILPPGPRPVVSSGESIEEALADRRRTRDAARPRRAARRRLDHEAPARLPLPRRANRTPRSIRSWCAPQFQWSPGRGAFACSDDQLTRIWAAAQYTLRLCMQGLMIDGIKRDRMPWAGDQALSTLANAFALGDGRHRRRRTRGARAAPTTGT